jgi:4-hydroxybenzoate polyprenyltransferase
LWRLARPRAAIIVAASPLAGFGFGHWDHALAWRNADLLPLVITAWLGLHMATMWLNAGADQDRGEVLFGHPTDVPSEAVTLAHQILVGSVVLAFFANIYVGACALGAAALSVLYSHPRTRWKAHPVFGPGVNAIGYGVLSPAAGWTLAKVPMGWRTLVVATLMIATALSVYFVAQVFQAEDDRNRGDRTLIVTHGARVVITATRLSLAYAAGGAVVLSILGAFPRPCMLAAPVWLWIDRWLVTEARRGRLDEALARRFVRRLFTFGLVLLVLATSAFVRDLRTGGPTAGQATTIR